MSCFGNRPASDLFENCCNAGNLCKFNGKLDDVVSTPIYVQSVYDAVLSNLQGMKTVQNQRFSPAVPVGSTILRVCDIRCKKYFNPCNVDDPRNLNLNIDTSISGATFLQNGNGDYVEVVGPDGMLSQKILYADTQECDDQCMGTPIFGTQNVNITGDVLVYIDLLLCDRCNNESVFTVCTQVNVATAAHPLVLTNFFECCMPSTEDTAFLPRFTEFANVACEARLATNSCGRDLSVGCDGEVCGNLILALCVSSEKKIVVPVQLCALSTGFAEIPTQSNPICSSFPALFPNRISGTDTEENCGEPCRPSHNACCDPCSSNGNNCGDSCGSGKPAPEKPASDCGCGCNECGPTKPGEPRHRR